MTTSAENLTCMTHEGSRSSSSRLWSHPSSETTMWVQVFFFFMGILTTLAHTCHSLIVISGGLSNSYWVWLQHISRYLHGNKADKQRAIVHQRRDGRRESEGWFIGDSAKEIKQHKIWGIITAWLPICILIELICSQLARKTRVCYGDMEY